MCSTLYVKLLETEFAQRGKEKRGETEAAEIRMKAGGGGGGRKRVAPDDGSKLDKKKHYLGFPKAPVEIEIPEMAFLFFRG